MCPGIFQNHSTNTPQLKRVFYVTHSYAAAGMSRYRLINVAPKWDPFNAKWPIKGHWGCFCKNIWKYKIKSVGTKPTANSNLTDRRQSKTDIKPHRGFQLLVSSSLASSCTAMSLGWYYSNGLTVSKHMLYKKNVHKKAGSKHSNGFEPTTSRESWALIWTSARPNWGRAGTATPLASCQRADP